MYCTYAYTYIIIKICSIGTHNCSQTCTNTEGGFSCGCGSGFELDDDGATCNGMYTNMS